MLPEAFGRYRTALSNLPPKAINLVVLSTLQVMLVLLDMFDEQDRDPLPALERCLARQIDFLEGTAVLVPHLVDSGADAASSVDMEELFESAWTTYSAATYDHSIGLILERFQRSGLDRNFFAGKRCFDGGCGTGRLSIVAAQLGAADVVAADIGAESLAFLDRQIQRLGVQNVRPLECDVTDLSRFEDGAFDFVASHGVLHHSADCLGGLREHFRIVRPGGTLWLYLYGDGGLYWTAFDQLRSVVSRFAVADVKLALQRTSLREGLTYTYLDNVLAPRTYYLESDIVRLLKSIDPGLTWRRAKGSSVADDVELSLATRFGKQIAGPQGEVRLIIPKSSYLPHLTRCSILWSQHGCA